MISCSVGDYRATFPGLIGFSAAPTIPAPYVANNPAKILIENRRGERAVRVHDVIERATGTAARCTLADAPMARLQEIQVRMLDPVGTVGNFV